MKNKCTHSRAAEIMTIGKCKIVAGSAYDINFDMDGIEPKYLLCVGGSSMAKIATDPLFEFTGNARGVFSKTSTMSPSPWKPLGTVVIDWPDMNAPPMEIDWWRALLSDLKRINGTVAVFCAGGHGRTGTSLAILAKLSGACGDSDPVDWVRDNYCDSAVETEEQIEYLIDLGVRTDAKPSKQRVGAKSLYLPAGAKADDDWDSPCEACTVGKDATWSKSAMMWLCPDCDKIESHSDAPSGKGTICADCGDTPATHVDASGDRVCGVCAKINTLLNSG